MRKNKLKSYSNNQTAIFGSSSKKLLKPVTTVINIHPAVDPREPQVKTDEQVEKMAKGTCCFPFSLCCGGK